MGRLLTKMGTVIKNEATADIEGNYYAKPNDGKIEQIGRVIGRVEPGWYFLQVYHPKTYAPIHRRIYPLKGMKEWIFFEAESNWKEFLKLIKDINGIKAF